MTSFFLYSTRYEVTHWSYDPRPVQFARISLEYFSRIFQNSMCFYRNFLGRYADGLLHLLQIRGHQTRFFCTRLGMRLPTGQMIHDLVWRPHESFQLAQYLTVSTYNHSSQRTKPARLYLRTNVPTCGCDLHCPVRSHWMLSGFPGFVHPAYQHHKLQLCCFVVCLLCL